MEQLRIPGPTPCPPEVLQAMARQMINHRGSEFQQIFHDITAKLKQVFQTKNDVLVLTGAGTGGLEAAVVNTLSPGDKVLSDAPDDEGYLWNQTVLQRAGDLIDHLSFHLYQPDREGWREEYDLEALHQTVCAAPLDVERIIQRIDRQIKDQVPGKKIGIISDTRLCKNCSTIANEKDLLICDSTFLTKHEDKAEEYFHMTAKQAATLAEQGKVGKLVLTHFSQRYKDVTDLEQEAKDIFPETVAAYDFMKIKL